ncbi:MAG TPA: pyridoxamine 5'-phosphate oxidase family protein [Dactylosporangium sp.]|nr:pyridoxamine 5'-phosphate oxidase family protein [Dactylosporangium sp.]
MSTTTIHTLTGERVWRDLAKASFAVVSYVTPAGEPRSSGVVYVIDRRRMWVAVAEDSWKARHIAAAGRVAVTVPVRRGGVMSLLFPIPPATISFHATATVHPTAALEDGPLARLLPPDRRVGCRVIEIQPVGHFVTYGEGVSLTRMRTPAQARARVPVG